MVVQSIIRKLLGKEAMLSPEEFFVEYLYAVEHPQADSLEINRLKWALVESTKVGIEDKKNLLAAVGGLGTNPFVTFSRTAMTEKEGRY